MNFKFNKMKKTIISIGAIIFLMALTVNVSLGINLSDDQDFGLSDLITKAHAQLPEAGCPWWNPDCNNDPYGEVAVPMDYECGDGTWHWSHECLCVSEGIEIVEGTGCEDANTSGPLYCEPNNPC